MTYQQLNLDWNTEPNAPEVELFVQGDSVMLTFYANYLLFASFKEGDQIILQFDVCTQYYWGGTNDEGYYCGQYRYTNDELPWGEFYGLATDAGDFPKQRWYSREEMKVRSTLFVFL